MRFDIVDGRLNVERRQAEKQGNAFPIPAILQVVHDVEHGDPRSGNLRPAPTVDNRGLSFLWWSCRNALNEDLNFGVFGISHVVVGTNTPLRKTALTVASINRPCRLGSSICLKAIIAPIGRISNGPAATGLLRTRSV